MQMGCHGIGISRIIGAVASLLSDSRGLNWPRVIAPFEAVVLSAAKGEEGDAVGVYDALRKGDVDVVLDDRADKGLGWKLRDADLIGYPVVIVLGRGWRERGEVEVQCRRLGVKRDIRLSEVQGEVERLLAQL